MARFKQLSDVRSAEPDYLVQIDPIVPVALINGANAASVQPNDPYYQYQWHFPAIQAEQAWARSTGAGVIIALIDTGIRQGTDLACRSFVDDFNAITDESGPGVAIDDNGHGTHVAGTLAQCTNNELGVAGLAYDAVLMPVKALDRDGNGSYSNVAQGIDWARTHGAQVINLSLGSPCGDRDWPACSSSIVNDAIAAAAADGIFIAVASGNQHQATVGFPANHPDVVAVGAVDLRQEETPYANYGSALAVVAPGGNMDLDANHDGYADGVLQQTFASQGWNYYFMEGTSMATPHVAAAAAMLKAFQPDATRQQIIAALESTAKDLGAPGFDTHYGYGLIQVNAALDALAGADTMPPTGDFIEPIANTRVAAPIWLRVQADDNTGGSGVARVVFTTNGSGVWAIIAEDREAPFEVQWDMADVPDGAYFMIGAEVYDGAGNRTNVIRWIHKAGGDETWLLREISSNRQPMPPSSRQSGCACKPRITPAAQGSTASSSPPTASAIGKPSPGTPNLPTKRYGIWPACLAAPPS